MRYIGCKRRLLPFISYVISQHNIEGETFCDLFSGTATVGNYFKQHGYQVIANDLLYCSYIQQQVKLTLNTMPKFEKLATHLRLNKNHFSCFSQAIIDYLNKLEGIEGFIYQNYSPCGTAGQLTQRLYYTDSNAKKIDTIRESIEVWKKLSLINDYEFCILLYALLDEASKRANTTGMQSSFLKHFTQNALKPVFLKLPEITTSNVEHYTYCQDSLDLIHNLDNIDILYLDPPYTKKQYAAAYHLLETISRWDYPTITGITGLRNTYLLKSTFCSKNYALNSLKKIVSQHNYRHLLLSYSHYSILSHEDILNLLNEYGNVQVHSHVLPRYSSIPKNKIRYQLPAHVEERLYYLKPYCLR